MGAEAAVRVAPHEIVRKQAPPGIRNAHRPVDERLQRKLPRRRFPKASQLFETKLPRRDDPRSPQRMPESRGSAVGRIGLCADVQRNIRAVLARQDKHPRIRDQDPVRSKLRKLSEIRGRLFQIRLMRENIGRDVDLHALRMGEGDALRHFFKGKIRGLRPKAEGLAAKIYRVRAVADRDLKEQQAPRRTKQLRMSVFNHFVLPP